VVYGLIHSLTHQVNVELTTTQAVQVLLTGIYPFFFHQLPPRREYILTLVFRGGSYSLIFRVHEANIRYDQSLPEGVIIKIIKQSYQILNGRSAPLLKL